MHRQSSNMDPKYVITHNGPMGSKSQQSSAAAFFARKNGGKPPQSPLHLVPTSEAATAVLPEVNHVSNFSGLLGKCPPPAPSSLLKRLAEDAGTNMAVKGPGHQPQGKVRVILRVAKSGVIDDKSTSGHCFRMDQKKRQVTLLDPSNVKNSSSSNSGHSDENSAILGAKMFAFDGLYTDEDSQSEVASSALADTLHGVVCSGVDGCLFAFGHAGLGKTYSMIGSDESNMTVGVIPSAIAWLFKAIKERKESKNVRFAVRVSALEIGGQSEEVRDLLAGQAASDSDNDSPPSQFFPPTNATANHILANLTELRCSTPERAGYYLDAALTSRSTNMAADMNGRDSHFVFSLHLYQYSVDSAANVNKGGCGVIGGRTRLHLVDFGCCDRTKTSGGSITLSGLGNVILGIFNGQRHLPCKESRVTQLLRECLGSFSCQATMLAHVTPEPSHYSETLHTTQLASRIHRMRRKKAHKGGTSSGGGSGGGSGGSSDDAKMNKLVRLPGTSSSDLTSTESEQSCDTVIYVGSRDDEGTDAEHPPVFIPNLNCGDNRGQMAKVLRGSTAEIKPKSSTLERKRHSKSPSNHRLHSPTTIQPPQPQPLQRLRPGSVGSTPTHSWKHMNPNGLSRQQQHLLAATARAGGGGSLPRNPKGKMPLTGRVAGYRQTPQHMPSGMASGEMMWLDQNRGQQQQQPQNWLPYQQQQMQTGSYDANLAIYGYMDDHKISMIQQWVECQATQRQAQHQQEHAKAMQASHQKKNNQEPEPFAWLNQPQEAETEDGCKVLTQFKTVDSDDSSNSDPSVPNSARVQVAVADVHHHPRQQQQRYPVQVPIRARYAPPPPKRASSTGKADSLKAGSTGSGGTPPLSPCIIVPENFHQHQQHQVPVLPQNKAIKRSSAPLPSGPLSLAKSPSDSAVFDTPSPLPVKNNEEATYAVVDKKKKTSSKKPEVQKNSESTAKTMAATGTNTNTVVPEALPTDKTMAASSAVISGNTGEAEKEKQQQWGNIRTIDELYNHCEALVETLSQASEELQQRNSSLIDNDVEDAKNGETSSTCDQVVPQKQVSQQHPLSQLSDENLTTTVSSLDSQKLHFVKKQQQDQPPRGHQRTTSEVVEPTSFDGVCEDAVSLGGGGEGTEEFFSKKFDQLAKLHELYQSVSSINAKAQSHLESTKTRNALLLNGGSEGIRSSCLSLSALMTDLEKISVNSGGDGNLDRNEERCGGDDANSLCSEPVKMYDYNDFADMNLNNMTNHTGGGVSAATAMTNSINDLFDFCSINNNNATTVSLSDLADATSKTEAASTSNGLAGFTSELNVSQMEDRSDSPVLEGIDQELAKYAKLKDLEQAYYHQNQKTASSATKSPAATPSPSTIVVTSPPTLQRNPDGASNPDLNYKSPKMAPAAFSPASSSSTSNGNGIPLPLRRSPGNGRSGSEPETEEFEANAASQKKAYLNGCSALSSDGHSLSSGGSGSCSVPSKSSPSGCSSMSSGSGGGGPRVAILHRPLDGKRSSRDERTVLGKSQSTDTSSDIEIWQQQQPRPQPTIPEQSALVSQPPASASNKKDSSNAVKYSRVPKFSRLFKLSRSPKVLNKAEASASKKRSKSADTRANSLVAKDKKLAASNNGKTASTTTAKLIDKRGAPLSSSASSLRTASPRKDPHPSSLASASNSSSQESKNAKGTSSSAACSQHQHQLIKPSSKSVIVSSSSGKKQGKNKNNSSSYHLPSPYAFPSAPRKAAVASTASESGSGYDSGLDASTVVAVNKKSQDAKKSSRFIKTCTFVKLRSKGGRGASASNTNSNANKSTNTLDLSKRASHRKSSGYESSAERDSVDSLKGISEIVTSCKGDNTCELTRVYPRMSDLVGPPKVVDYDSNFIQRLDERWRLAEARRLQHRQKELKTDLAEAKGRIGADPARWSFELHVADSVQAGVVAETEPAIVEALEKETAILGKRVAAAKSHAVLTTSFDVKPLTSLEDLSPVSKKLIDGCCTTTCEPAQSMLLSSTSQETEIF